MIQLVKTTNGVIYWENELSFTYDVLPQGWQFDGNNHNFLFVEFGGSLYGFPIDDTTIDDLSFSSSTEFIQYLYS